MAKVFLCWQCVENTALREWIQDAGSAAICTYCHKRRRSCRLKTVADRIDEVLRTYYEIAEETAHFSAESDNPYYQADGDTAREIIESEAGVSERIASDLDDYLHGLEERDVRDGGDPFYGETILSHIGAYSGHYMEMWNEFEQRLKHEVRFFDEKGKKILDELIGDIAGIAEGHAIVTLEPGTADSIFFRARIVGENSSLFDVVTKPAPNLGPPPPERARAGRMNPAGISVFYGAFAAEVAVSEVRPSVGSTVAIGKFSLMRQVKLLDLSYLPYAYHQESIFSDYYDTARSKVTFLSRLHNRISRPVLPSDEVLAYLPTQAVAAYVTNVLGFDGVIYASLQIGAKGDTYEQVPRNKCNVALFGKAARVKDAKPKPVPFEDTFPSLPPLFGLRPRFSPVIVGPAVVSANDASGLAPPQAPAPAPQMASIEDAIFVVDKEQAVAPSRTAPGGVIVSDTPQPFAQQSQPPESPTTAAVGTEDAEAGDDPPWLRIDDKVEIVEITSADVKSDTVFYTVGDGTIIINDWDDEEED